MLLFWFIIVWLLGGLLIGVSSFGGNLFAVPITAMFYAPKGAIVIGCIAGACMCLALSVIYFRHILWKDVALLDLGCVAGIYPGVWILAHASERSLLLGCAAVIALFLLWNKISKKHEPAIKSDSLSAALILGFFSGLMTGSLSVSGVAMGIYAYLTSMPKENALATLNTAGAPVLLAGVPFQHMAGLVPPETALLGIYGGLASVAGVILSVPLIKRMNQEAFTKVVLATLALSVLMLAARGIF